ncbi:MAG TPA: hypothetical protein VG013_26305 [Gemmataceae bacterium]|jgi:hypothetical protein|nr:hypothetical protein [Gemmataceae bacterium]
MAEESSAVVSRVPSPYGGRLLNLRTSLTKNGLFVLQVVVIFGGSFVPAVLGVVAGQRFFPKNTELSFLPVLAGLGLTALLLWLFIGQLLRNPWSSRYIYHKTRTEFLQRPDAIVDPNNPDAILVEVIPRRNWGQLMLENAEDQGFLLVDRERRQLLFEGDNQRYRIPARALISSEVEVMNKNSESDQRGVPVASAVITFRDDRVGKREVPLLPRRTVSGDTLGGNYVERAHELQRRILSLSAE